jgi:hypothetical protein
VSIKKLYIKPSVTLVYLDKSVTLMMISNTDPWGGGAKSRKKSSKPGADEPFQSPFGDKPFS